MSSEGEHRYEQWFNRKRIAGLIGSVMAGYLCLAGAEYAMHDGYKDEMPPRHATMPHNVMVERITPPYYPERPNSTPAFSRAEVMRPMNENNARHVPRLLVAMAVATTLVSAQAYVKGRRKIQAERDSLLDSEGMPLTGEHDEALDGLQDAFDTQFKNIQQNFRVK